MSIHRWWLALVAALLTPWIGPHIDRYTPVGWVLAQAADGADAAFWLIAGMLLVIGYALWLGVFTVLAALTSRRRKDQD
jgi:predicted metal-binding membrane protein